MGKYTALIVGVLCGACLMWVILEISFFMGTSRDASSVPYSEVVTEDRTIVPVRLDIPSVAVATRFERPLDIATDMTIEVPERYDTVGWYKHSPVPGDIGPSVVLGHVDSRSGPGVFFELWKVSPGEHILIERSDGSVATFEVTSLRFVSGNRFSTESVYGDIDHAGLRLITCTGIYDAERKQYSHNLIVYAELLSIKHVI